MARLTRAALAFAVTLGAALPATAQDAFPVPEGCEGVLTIQHRSCIAVNMWRCEADAPGEQWIGLFIPQGLFSVRKVDDEFQWLETRYAFPPRTEVMDQPADDPGSITDLVANGVDTFDFVTRSTNDTPPERTIGFDMLTGEEELIDGEPLLPTAFEVEHSTPDGTVTSRSAGTQHVSERHRIFVLGLSWDPETPDDITDMSPVEFIYPGEPGFFSAAPKFDCGVTDAGFLP